METLLNSLLNRREHYQANLKKKIYLKLIIIVRKIVINGRNEENDNCD